MVKFLDLPQDILIAIYAYITPQDLLTLNQTCRTLHALGTSDYVWRQLEISLPLDTDRKMHTGEYRPFYQIRRSLINALRVEANWGSKSTQIRRLARIDHGSLLSRVQLLRDDWLVTLSRNQTTNATYLSAWHLDGDGGAHCAAKVEITGNPSKFAAGIQDDGDNALVALFDNSRASGRIQVFHLALTDDYLYEDTLMSTLKRVLEISPTSSFAPGYDPMEHQGIFAEIQVNRNIVAASLAKTNRSGPPLTYQVVLVNVDTHAAVVLRQNLVEDLTGSRFAFKLFPEHVAILFAKLNEGSLFWKDIKDMIQPSRSLCPSSFRRDISPTTLFMDKLAIIDIGSLHPHHTSEFFSMSYDILFTAETLRPAQSTLGMLSRRLEKLWFFRLTLAPAANPPGSSSSRIPPSISVVPVAGLSMKSGSHIEYLALGRMGYRMIWLERSWETDEYKLMKATLPEPGKGDRILAHELIPPHIALPFELHKCITIWFEEATCQICFGLHTGEVYILEL